MEHEIVFKVGTAGGSISIARIRTPPDEWWFVIELNESATYDMLSDEDLKEIESMARPRREVVPSLDLALRQLDEYPWLEMHRSFVHPEYRDAIQVAALQRGGWRGRGGWATDSGWQ